jgi:hypothetical protein
LFPLLSRRTAGRDEAEFVAAQDIDHHEQIAGISESDCYEAVFAFGVRVLDRQGKRIMKYASASANETPCFLRFAAALAGSNWNRIGP